MTEDLVELTLQIELPEANADEMDRVGRSLRAELLDQDVASMERPTSGPAPEGAKGAEWLVGPVGEWVIVLGIHLVPLFFEHLKRWQERAPASAMPSIKVIHRGDRLGQSAIEYDPAGLTPEQLADLATELQQSLAQK
jgi:hypothetical protein